MIFVFVILILVNGGSLWPAIFTIRFLVAFGGAGFGAMMVALAIVYALVAGFLYLFKKAPVSGAALGASATATVGPRFTWGDVTSGFLSVSTLLIILPIVLLSLAIGFTAPTAALMKIIPVVAAVDGVVFLGVLLLQFIFYGESTLASLLRLFVGLLLVTVAPLVIDLFVPLSTLWLVFLAFLSMLAGAAVFFLLVLLVFSDVMIFFLLLQLLGITRGVPFSYNSRNLMGALARHTPDRGGVHPGGRPAAGHGGVCQRDVQTH